MTQDEIIEMATQVGMYGLVEGGLIEEFKAFAKLVADKERESCAKVAEDGDCVVDGEGYYDQLGDANKTAWNIAKVIRARGQE